MLDDTCCDPVSPPFRDDNWQNGSTPSSSSSPVSVVSSRHQLLKWQCPRDGANVVPTANEQEPGARTTEDILLRSSKTGHEEDYYCKGSKLKSIGSKGSGSTTSDYTTSCFDSESEDEYNDEVAKYTSAKCQDLGCVIACSPREVISSLSCSQTVFSSDTLSLWSASPANPVLQRPFFTFRRKVGSTLRLEATVEARVWRNEGETMAQLVKRTLQKKNSGILSFDSEARHLIKKGELQLLFVLTQIHKVGLTKTEFGKMRASDLLHFTSQRPVVIDVEIVDTEDLEEYMN